VGVMVLLAARSLLVQSMFADPVRVWEDAVRRAPHSVEARYELAAAYVRRGDPRGDAIMRAIPRLAPRDPRTWVNLAAHHVELGRPEEAAAAMEQAVALAPRSAALRNNLGVLYLQLGRTADAVRELEAAVQGEPPLAQARIDLARVLLDQGDPARARALLDEAARLEIDAADARAIEELRGKLQ
jgi:Tfp pilus assembly protein PilF